MTAATRFNAWRGVVGVTLAADAMFAATGRVAFAIVAFASLLGIVALLATTPTDAIRLPRARSEQIILIGYAAVASVATRGEIRHMLVLLVAAAAVVVLLAICRLASISAWWVAVLAWQPMVIAVARFV